jgi:hypothetical protein
VDEPEDPDVAKSVIAELDIATDLATAYSLVTDESYVSDVATATGGTDVTVSVTHTPDGGAAVVSSRTLPADVPSYAKAMIGETIALTETREFGPAAADGSRTGTITVAFAGAPVTITGTLGLSAGGRGTLVAVGMTIKASVPFVGGKIEQLCADQIEAALRTEEKIANARV